MASGRLIGMGGRRLPKEKRLQYPYSPEESGESFEGSYPGAKPEGLGLGLGLGQ